MGINVRIASLVLLAGGVAAAPALAAQGLRSNPGLPGPGSGATVKQGSAGASARSAGGPVFDQQVLEMTPATLDRFGKALEAEEAARKRIVAKANAPLPKATKTKEEYQQCQMQLMMDPEFQQLLQESLGAVSSASNDPEAASKAGAEMQAKMEAAVEKRCGPDPDKTYTKPDVNGLMRTAQSDAAKASGFTDRQYAILKERVTPFCFSDQLDHGPNGVKIKGDGAVFFVYSGEEVAALQPRCEAFLKALYPNKR